MSREKQFKNSGKMAKMLSSKVKTGIPGLDELAGGGFNRGSICAVIGSTGSGRTTFALQFLVKGTEEGENGLLISFDQQKGNFFANALPFGWDLPQLEQQKKFIFIEYPQNELEHFVEQEGAIRDLIDSLGIQRVAIDSITPFAVLFPEADERMRNLMKLVQALRKWNVTLLVSAEDISTMQSMPRSSSGIESFSDGLIHLTFERTQDGRRVRAIEIVKLRGCAHQHGAFEAKLDSRGFSLAGFETQMQEAEKERPLQNEQQDSQPRAQKRRKIQSQNGLGQQEAQQENEQPTQPQPKKPKKLKKEDGF